MTEIPETNFTKEQLFAALEYDGIDMDSRVVKDAKAGNKASLFKIAHEYYYTDRKQYEKAFAWFILSANCKHREAQFYVGNSYHEGKGVPINYLCALKWYLKSADKSYYPFSYQSIGELFDKGLGVPVDKYKALEWYRHFSLNTFFPNMRNLRTADNNIKNEGYHLSDEIKQKKYKQLLRETEIILEKERRKLQRALENKQYKTKDDLIALQQLRDTFGQETELKDEDLDALIDEATPPPKYEESIGDSVEKSITDYEDEILMLKNEIQFLKQEKVDFGDQAKEIQSLKQEKTDLELMMKRNNQEITSLRNEIQHGRATIQHQTNDNTVHLLERENQELKLKIFSLEYEVKSKDDANKSLETENQSLKWESATFEYQLKAKDNEISSLEKRAPSLQQIQDSLKQENKMTNLDLPPNDIEQLRLSTLEQLLKSKEDVILSLNREIQTLSTVNQDGMVETLKSLLQSKSNEMELNKLNMERVLNKEKKKNKKLQKEIEILKASNGNTVSTDIKDDDPSNDINYSTEDNGASEDD